MIVHKYCGNYWIMSLESRNREADLETQYKEAMLRMVGIQTLEKHVACKGFPLHV